MREHCAPRIQVTIKSHKLLGLRVYLCIMNRFYCNKLNFATISYHKWLVIIWRLVSPEYVIVLPNFVCTLRFFSLFLFIIIIFMEFVMNIFNDSIKKQWKYWSWMSGIIRFVLITSCWFKGLIGWTRSYNTINKKCDNLWINYRGGGWFWATLGSTTT